MQGARAPQPGATNRPSPSGHIQVPSAPDRSQESRFPKRCAAPRAPWSATRPQQPAPQRPPGAGGHGGRGTPGPIPNPEVKPASADGTAGATLWESRAPPAPGARCAGLGAGRRDMSTWERGTRGGPPLSSAGVSRVFAKKKGRRRAHAGLSAAFSRSGASRSRCAAPDGATRSAVGAGPLSDVAPFKRRRADLVGRSRVRLSPGRPGLCIWGPPARIPHADFSRRRRAGVPYRARTALPGRCEKAAGKPRGLAGGFLRVLFVLAWF